MFPIDEQSLSSDPNGATPAAPVPSVPDKQQKQHTGATETDTCEQTSGQVISDSPATSAKDNVTEDKTVPNETGEETSSQPINLKTGNNLVTLFANIGLKHYLSFQIFLE